MLYYRKIPNLSQTNLNEVYASQSASIERGGHPDMEFLHDWHDRVRFDEASQCLNPLHQGREHKPQQYLLKTPSFTT